MEMHEIRYFLTACDTLNFTRAAEVCGVTTPTLTRAIKKLEEAKSIHRFASSSASLSMQL